MKLLNLQNIGEAAFPAVIIATADLFRSNSDWKGRLASMFPANSLKFVILTSLVYNVLSAITRNYKDPKSPKTLLGYSFAPNTVKTATDCAKQHMFFLAASSILVYNLSPYIKFNYFEMPPIDSDILFKSVLIIGIWSAIVGNANCINDEETIDQTFTPNRAEPQRRTIQPPLDQSKTTVTSSNVDNQNLNTSSTATQKPTFIEADSDDDTDEEKDSSKLTEPLDDSKSVNPPSNVHTDKHFRLFPDNKDESDDETNLKDTLIDGTEVSSKSRARRKANQATSPFGFRPSPRQEERKGNSASDYDDAKSRKPNSTHNHTVKVESTTTPTKKKETPTSSSVSFTSSSANANMTSNDNLKFDEKKREEDDISPLSSPARTPVSSGKKRRKRAKRKNHVESSN